MTSANGTCVLLAASLVLLAACASDAPTALPPMAPRQVAELARWEVWSEGRLVGHVKKLEIRDPERPVAFYRIEDLQGRWLGHASDEKRFSRRVPFRDDEEDLGVWAMERGVAELFDAKAAVELKAIAVEADAKKR
jgi:hypothetical protein